TTGLVDPIREALLPYRERIAAAFVYGAVAKGSHQQGGDIDVMVLSDLPHGEISGALHAIESALGRPIDPTVISIEEWRKKAAKKRSFVTKLLERPKLFVFGSEDDLWDPHDAAPPQKLASAVSAE